MPGSPRREYTPEELELFEQNLEGRILQKTAAKRMGLSPGVYHKHFMRWQRELTPEQKERFAKMINRAPCVACGREDTWTRSGKVYCRACAIAMQDGTAPQKGDREQMLEERRLRRIAEHRCTRCGEQDAVTLRGGKTCQTCRKWCRLYMQNLKDREAEDYQPTMGLLTAGAGL